MGLADRDYMRDRHRQPAREQPFRPPQPKTPVLGILLYFVVAGFLLFKLVGWYQESRAIKPQTLSSTSRVSIPPQDDATPAPRIAPSVSETPSTAATPREKKLWRCEQDGQVLYSDRGCDRSLATRPPERYEEAPPAPAHPATTRTQIYLCKSYDGGMFWSSAHCNQQRAHIERIASVPPGLFFDEQVVIARQQRDAALQVIENSYVPPVQSAQGPSELKAQCAAIDEAIRGIDARARQPLPGFEQDRLAAERKRLRDQQFRIRCT